MNYNETIEYINNESKKGSIYGLDTINNFLDKLNRPDSDLNIISIAGTNGKGSTSSFITNILIDAGYKVGTFNSPAVFSFNETFLINGQAASNELCAKYISMVKEEVDELVKENSKYIPTSFEQQFAAALLMFKNENCDIVILEAGMGGKDDATNSIKDNLVSIITSINYDHTEYLGDTLEKIAENKFGIVRKNLITCKQNRNIMKIFRKAHYLKVCKTPVPQISTLSSQTFLYGSRQYKIQMIGLHQLNNAALAIECAKFLRKKGFKIKYKNITKGLFNTTLPGRIEVINFNGKKVILDGAHNVEAAKALHNCIKALVFDNKTALVFGAFKDKDIDGVLSNIEFFDSPIYIASAPTERGLDLSSLKNICLKYYKNVITNTSISNALKNALDSDAEYIIVFGSFSILSEAKAYIRGNNG